MIIDGKPRIMFDTSGLNALADDPESGAVVRSLGVGFKVLLSETNVTEIVSTTDPARRERLLGICQHLVSAGICVNPHHGISHELARGHLANPSRFDWRQIDIRFPELEVEIARREFLADPELALEACTHNKATNKQFVAMYKEVREEFEPLLNRDEPITVSTVIEALDEGPLWKLAGDFYKSGTGIDLDEAGSRKFIDACPPLRALLLSLCVAQYHWAVRDSKEESVYKAGALDLFMAIYLPYCDRFITSDSGQHNALRLAASEAGLKTKVCTYAEFRRSWLLDIAS